jgi:putative ABC transport system permease protein
MSNFQLLRRSLGHYWRTHLGVILGTALAALVLTGALLVGDSVKATLRKQAEARVGQIGEVFVTGERFVRWAKDPKERGVVAGTIRPKPAAAGVLLLQGTAVRPDQSARANQVQVLGVEDAFWKLSPSGKPVALSSGQVAMNTRLAGQLDLKVGEDLLLRLEKPSAFSKDAPLSGEESGVISFRATVAQIVGEDDFGRFALTSGQIPPASIFLPLGDLQAKVGLIEKVNLVVQGGTYVIDPPTIPETTPLGIEVVTGEQFQVARVGSMLHAAELEIRDLPSNLGVEMRTPRVFLEPSIVEAVRKNESTPAVEPSGAAPLLHGMDALTYFVNELRAGDGSDPQAKATPYSMVTALDAPASGFVPAELADDEITITRWLADDLGVDVGAKITIKYFVMGDRRQLIEKARTFTVLGPILEMNEPQLNTSWMPEFPNVPDKDGFSNWKPGFPFESTRIRKKDEDYWSQYRGTPKAFVNLRIGQEMWGNRWGNLTSVRYPAGTKREQVERVGAFLDSAVLGFRIVPLREQALAATNAPVDFGQLFAGFSFFLILAAAVLTGLLFTFSIEQRASEAGVLLAVGWTAKKVRRLFLREGLILALIGAVAGVFLAIAYTHLVLRALSGVWGGATGGTQFIFGAQPLTYPIGIASGVVVALLAMFLASRRLFKREAAELLAGIATDQQENEPPHSNKGGDKVVATQGAEAKLWNWTGRAIELLAVIGGACLLLVQPKNPILFFGGGFLLLLGGLSFSYRQLRKIGRASSDLPSSGALALRNTSRRRGRSLATIGILASGVFMVVAVDSFRKGPLDDPTRRESGTGGFSLYGESSSPIYEDLNSAQGREEYSLDDELMKDVRFVQLRVREGDDASCLNLNRAVQPRMVGVRFAEITGRFAAEGKADWRAISASTAGDAMPALVDANTLQWAMQKKIGDSLEYEDERGQPLSVRIAATFPASMLQGLVIVDEAAFIRRFPNNAGYNMFLIDCPPAKSEAVRDHLSKQLGDRGLEVVSSATRLAEFNAVENTYLSIFQVLGGLGLLLGSAGLGIVVARNVLERRREFGLLEAVGFTPRQLRALVFAEHRWLIIFALGIGAISALVAVWPNLAGKAGGFPWQQSSLLLGGMALLGAFWTWLATRVSLRGSLLGALRDE